MTSPRSLERLEIDRSATPGAVAEPPAIPFTYKRFSEPPVQRTPPPNGTPPATSALPWRKMQDAPECMLVPVKVIEPGSTESATRSAVPVAERSAPGLPVFAQPTPAPLGLPHTQGI